MIKLTKVSFNTKKDLALALMEGREFKAHPLNDAKMHYDTTQQSPFRHGGGAIDDYWSDYNALYEVIEYQWHDDLPEGGVLCWVWDAVEDNPYDVAVFVRTFEENSAHPYRATSVGWQFDTPIDQYINDNERYTQ